MARFWQRTKNGLTAPAQYIQVTDSVSRPMAVMLSLVMFFIAIALLVCIFFAGKWGYDQLFGKDSKPSNPITGISTGVSTDSKDTTNQGSGSTATVTSNGTGSASVTATQPSSTSVTTNSTPNQTTTTSTTTVPNTGAGNTLVVFIVSSSLGVLVYRAVLIRKLQ